jgi:hypothetical protein
MKSSYLTGLQTLSRQTRHLLQQPIYFFWSIVEGHSNPNPAPDLGYIQNFSRSHGVEIAIPN